MRGVIVTGMVVVLMLKFARRPLCIAQDECETSIHRRQHETGRNERSKEQQPEDQQRRPSWNSNVPHRFHRCAESRTIRSKLLKP